MRTKLADRYSRFVTGTGSLSFEAFCMKMTGLRKRGSDQSLRQKPGSNDFTRVVDVGEVVF